MLKHNKNTIRNMESTIGSCTWTRRFAYRMAQMFDGRNFDEFDESKLHHQNFSFLYFAVELNNLSASTCNIYGSHESLTVCTYCDSLVFQLRSDKA